MSVKSPFAIQKALIGIGGEPKSVKRLRSGDLLIETTSALQTKSFLLAKSFLNRPVTVSPHKSLNSCRGVISEPDLLGTSDSEILEGFSAQGVTQCQRFGHSQTACRGQLTCSRCASVGHASSDCTLEQRCVNCSQPHSSDSKLCPKWKIEKQIQEIKTNNNISYQEARTLITPQLSQTYAQVAKSSTATKSDPTASNGEHFNAPEVPQCAKRNSRNRRKRPKVQKAEIKIQMAPHRPRKSTPTESTTDEEDMIMYDVQAEELEPNPEDKFAVMECFVNNPSEYMRALTPTRFRNSNN
ncbi:uncharacterized protein TNCV_9541 [Trichonephila clavipes]|nr:uncharacterized protein TNCV_9541 [Trichonephila clavipes]